MHRGKEGQTNTNRSRMLKVSKVLPNPMFLKERIKEGTKKERKEINIKI